MRYLKLSISLILSVIGLVVYFVTIPRIDEDELVHLTALAGDESILDDYYFNGYISNYSSFAITDEDILVPGNLPFLERLDASDDMDIMILREDYPNFVDTLTYNTNTHSYLISSDDDYLASAHFEYQSGMYAEIYSKLLLRTLNKETNEIVEDKIPRNQGSNVYYTSIIGIYENYPEISVLLDTRMGGPMDDYASDTGEISLVSYNFETKNLLEEVLVKTPSYLDTSYYSSVHYNTALQVFYSIDYETEAPITYIMNYGTGEMTRRDVSGERLIVSDDSRLYNVVGNTLIEMNEAGDVLNDVEFSTDFKELKPVDFEMSYLHIIDDQLFVLDNNQSAEPEEEDAEIKPTNLVVYDISTGEILVEALFTYDEAHNIESQNAYVDMILKNTSKD